MPATYHQDLNTYARTWTGTYACNLSPGLKYICPHLNRDFLDIYLINPGLYPMIQIFIRNHAGTNISHKPGKNTGTQDLTHTNINPGLDRNKYISQTIMNFTGMPYRELSWLILTDTKTPAGKSQHQKSKWGNTHSKYWGWQRRPNIPNSPTFQNKVVCLVNTSKKNNIYLQTPCVL